MRLSTASTTPPVYAHHVLPVCLSVLAAWMLLSGLDDFFITLVYLFPARKKFVWPLKHDLERAPERRIAIMVPLWNEYAVIGRMLERNLAVVEYGNYDIFAGVYANDDRTARAVAEIAARHPRVHLARHPHNGPTSKGDCLNWVYRFMQQYEAEHGVRFELILTHDAEDLVHADSLRLVNWYSRDYAMVQIPVLPLPTGPGEFTHGVYCDEFAEYQTKDIPVRQRLGGFVPSNGVGTGFWREAMERLAAQRGGVLFNPDCLTEDYESGFRLHSLGYRQLFVPLRFGSQDLAATREYFPRRWRPAVRQRSRWVGGIVLQGWEHFGWRAPLAQKYWLWRDRKGLLSNLVTPAANALFLYGLISLVMGWGGTLIRPALLPRWVVMAGLLNLAISAVQLSVRTRCASRIYGPGFAWAAPLRIFWGNMMNCTATLKALAQFFRARRNHSQVAWLKTDHLYPMQQPEGARPRLGEVLVRMRIVPMSVVEEALVSGRNGLRLGEYLVHTNKLSEKSLYQALSCQAGLPLGGPRQGEVNPRITRLFPVRMARRWKVLPYRVEIGQLHVLTPNLPTDEMTRELSQVCRLELRFHLTTPGEFDALAGKYWGAEGSSASRPPLPAHIGTHNLAPAQT